MGRFNNIIVFAWLLCGAAVWAQEKNRITAVDVFSKANAEAHRTSKYEILDSYLEPLIVRRGDKFRIAVNLLKPFDEATEKLRLELMFGTRPNFAEGSMLYVPINAEANFTQTPGKWGVNIAKVDAKDNALHLDVHIPANVAVGIWRMAVNMKPMGSPHSAPFQVSSKIYVLFNAWAKDDAVFMDNEEWRQEFVLNDVGTVYVGSYFAHSGRPWIYGQFSGAVLQAVMFLMERARLPFSERGNPVVFSRAITEMVNRYRSGVVSGKWSGSYADGVEPTAWTGSGPIIEQYFKTGGESVKYGQCWVFGGVTTTVGRALGLPTRTISNFASAHDTDASLTIDNYFDVDGRPMREMSSDSVWNFHVWNEAWMTRPDLIAGYGGWQVIDATPQETSDGKYQTGPSSMVAIKQGELGFSYDMHFVFAEVNSDTITWLKDPESLTGWKIVKVDTAATGMVTLTKKVGVNEDDSEDGLGDSESLSDQYKYPEGTPEERMAVLNAAKTGGVSLVYEVPSKEHEDVDFKLVPVDKTLIGKPFNLTIEMTNKKEHQRIIAVSVFVKSIYYTGIIANGVKEEMNNYTLDGYQKQVLEIAINPEDYLDKLVDFAFLKIYAMAQVTETKQVWSLEENFSFEKPSLALKLKAEELTVGLPSEVEISFTNPFESLTLTNCAFSMEAPGLLEKAITVKVADVAPKAKVTFVQKLMPQKTGPLSLVVVFNSRQLIDVHGSKRVNVVA